MWPSGASSRQAIDAVIAFERRHGCRAGQSFSPASPTEVTSLDLGWIARGDRRPSGERQVDHRLE
jgi:hypothetical protein